MGNSLCCISSKPHKGQQSNSINDRTPQLRLKKGSLNNATSNKKYTHSGHHRQSEIDYYYDDYEEMAKADKGSTSHLTKKVKKTKSFNQPNKKQPLKNYSDLRLQHTDIHKLNITTASKTTLLNTHGLDSDSKSYSTSASQLRDNSKIISHFSNTKLANKPNSFINKKKPISTTNSLKSVNTNEIDAKSSNLANAVKLNNQIIINPNHNCAIKCLTVSKLNDQSKMTSDINAAAARESNVTDLSSTSTSSILASSSSQFSASKNSGSIQYAHIQSHSSTYIDPKKNELRHINETEDFESEPNLNVERETPTKLENARRLTNRTRGSSLNQSLKEATGRAWSDACDNSEVSMQKEENVGDSALMELNWEKYKSLQKSKRSIQNLEETMKKSRSIEQWLNDFSKLDNDSDVGSNVFRKKEDRHSGPVISKRKLVKLDKLKRSHTSLDENDEDNYQQTKELNLAIPTKESQATVQTYQIDSSLSTSASNDSCASTVESSASSPEHISSSADSRADASFNTFLAELRTSPHPTQTCHKLIDTVELLMRSNRPKVVKKMEQKLAKELEDFLLPKSNSYSDDIDMLKWLLNDKDSVHLKLINPVINETLYTHDHLTYSTQQTHCYLLIANSLKVKLVELKNNDDMFSDYLDREKIQNMENEFIKFVLDTSHSDGKQTPTTSGELVLEKSLIETLMSKEKELEKRIANRTGVINNSSEDIDYLTDKELLEQLRMVLSTSNFKGAQSLYNIKRKQMMNKKTGTAVGRLLSPISINSPSSNKMNRSASSSGTTSPSMSSISPSSSNCMSNNNTLVDVTSPNEADLIQFADLNERLFACLLSNFSCQLVEAFLKNCNQSLSSSGFIRKKKNDKSFQFIRITKSEDRDLKIEKSSFKLCLKLDKWPESFQQGFFNRKRISKTWPKKTVLEEVYSNQCLISYHEPVDFDQDFSLDSDEQKLALNNKLYASSARWQINTSKAEATLFESLSKHNVFQFYYFYIVFMNIKVELSNETKMKLKKLRSSCSPIISNKITQNSQLYLFNFINERIFMHHYFRFLEIEEDQNIETSAAPLETTIVNLINQSKKFSSYLSFVLEKYNDLNRPNYFDLSKPILSHTELKSIYFSNFSSHMFSFHELINTDIKLACKDFNNILVSKLVNKLQIQTRTPASLIALLNTFLDTIQLRLPSTTTTTILRNELHISPLPAHYGANTYLYEYVHEYASIIYDQFKTKRDQFKISETMLLQLHKKVLLEKFGPCAVSGNKNHFVELIERIDSDRLFSKFEEYAECVHKYLPQIRHKNQYLLFHYVWTMQVQYMAPFFNYLCDFYLPIE